MKITKKRAQEEIVGFVLIVIIIAVIILAFISFSLREPEKETLESYEVESFIQSSLQYTTDCRDNLEFLRVQKLIYSCDIGETCVNGKDSCDVLNFTLKSLVNESWPVGEDRPIKGYVMNITSDGADFLSFSAGNETGNSKGAIQILPNEISIVFKVYY